MVVDDTEFSRSNKALVVLVLAIVCFIAARTHADPDLWGHVRFGQDMLANGIHNTDPYSYLSGDRPWINHELLAEILFGAAFNAYGAPGLVLLKVSLVLITVGLLFRRLLSQRLHALRAGIVIIVVLMLMSVGIWTIRPQLLTYVFFLLTVLFIDAAEKGRRAAFWALPIVMLVWANSHGGFLAGVGVVGIWACARIAVRLFTPAVKTSTQSGLISVVIVAAACVGATLVNPYGANLLLFLLRTGTVARPEIGEWQPISIVSPEGVVYLVTVTLSVVVLLLSQKSRRPALLVVLFVTAILPLIALRHLPLFALSFAVFMGEHVADVWNRWSPSKNSSGVLLQASAWIASLVFLAASIPYFGCIRVDRSFIRYPAKAVALMKVSGVRGNAATFFDWGEYMIWHLPDVRVSIDGRRETVYSQPVYDMSLRFFYGIGEWDRIVDDRRTDMVLVGRDQPTYNLMRLKPGWQLMHEDSFSALYARPGSAQAAALRNLIAPDLPADGVGLCFP